MKKLFNFKEWLTVNEAARYLASLFQEDVTEADVLRLALDGHLTLSVNFVNYAKGREACIVPMKDALMYVIERNPERVPPIPAILAKDVLQKDTGMLSAEIKKGLTDFSLCLMPKGDLLNDSEVMQYGADIKTLKGVWDLTMIGVESLDIEHLYQMHTGGPEVTLGSIAEGAIVRSIDGDLFQTLDSFDDNEHQSGSLAQLEHMKQYIADNNIDAERADRMFERHKKERKEYLERRQARPRSEDYYPAGALPKDSVLVVRASALQDFQASLLKSDAEKSKPLNDRAETTYLNIIGGLLGLMLNKSPSGKAQSVFKDQSAIISSMLAHYPNVAGIKQRTLEEKFAGAKRSLEGN